MPTIHRAPKPPRKPWLRGDLIAVVGVLVAIVGIGISMAVSGGDESLSVTQNNTNNVTNNFNGPNTGDQQQVPADQVSTQVNGCREDRDDESLMTGWGPPRNLIGSDQLSEFPSLNLDNSPEIIGDERIFYSVREAGTPAPNRWKTSIEVETGKTYTIRAYIHNSAPRDFVAKGVRLSVLLPVCTGRRIISSAFVKADNTEPREIYGGITFLSNERFNLRYVPGSAKICNNHYGCNENGNGAPISDDVFTSKGVLLGYDSLDGEIPGGYQYSTYFGFDVDPQFAGE